MIDVFLYQGKVRKTTFDRLGDLKGKKVWIDLIDTDARELDRIRKKFNIHPLTVDDMLHRNVRVKVEEFNTYLFIVLYGLEKDAGFKLIEGDYLIGRNFVISSHKKELNSHKYLKENKDVLATVMKRGTDFLLHKLLDDGIEEALPVVDYVDDQVEAIEKKITDNPDTKVATKILELKQQVFRMRKNAMAQRDKIGSLVMNDHRFLSKDSRPYFRDLYDRTIMIADAIENVKESVQSAFEAHMSAVNNRMGEVMKVLSVIATIALPLSVISSIWGTNFVNLPGMYSANGFWIMISFMVLLVGGMFLWFAKKRWV